MSVPETGALAGTGVVSAFASGSSASVSGSAASSSLTSATSSGISSGASKFSFFPQFGDWENELATHIFQHLLDPMDFDISLRCVAIHFEGERLAAR